MKKERTFVIIKPDGVQRSLIGEIIQRIERTGLKMVGIKMAIPTEEKCWKHYNKDDVWFLAKGEKIVKDRESRGMPITQAPIEYGKEIIGRLVKYMTCGPVICMVIEGNQSVGIVKKLVGTTEPLTSDVGTIRGDLTIDSYSLADLDTRAVRNLIHCTDKPEEAQGEINLWFKEDELVNYRLVQEAILYDVNIDGVLE